MIAAAILAGGRATRFGGRDKSAMLVEGRTILERQLQMLTHAADDVFLVGHPMPPPGIRTIPDVIVGAGPLGGLHAALSATDADITLVLACDMPFVTSRLLAHLAACCRECDAVIPRTERGYHPLCAAYRRTCLEPVTRRLSEGRRKLADLVADMHSRIVSANELATFGDPERLLANVNTPADLDSLEALHTQEP